MCRMRALIFSALSICAVCSAAGPTVTKADVEKWMTELSNWGRWGKDDQMGTVNLITPAKRKEAQPVATRVQAKLLHVDR